MKSYNTGFITTIIFTVLLFPALSSATMITFDDDPPAFQQAYGEGSIYEEGDYFLSTTSDHPVDSGSIIRFNPDTQSGSVPHNGSIHMGATYFSNPWLQRSDNGAFDLISLEIAEYSEFVQPPVPLNITGLTTEGQVLSANLFIDNIFDGAGGVNDFQFFSLNWSNLVRLDFNDTGFSFDNIHVNSPSVPEPSTIALLGFGLAGLAVAEVRRRRKKKAVMKR